MAMALNLYLLPLACRHDEAGACGCFKCMTWNNTVHSSTVHPVIYSTAQFPFGDLWGLLYRVSFLLLSRLFPLTFFVSHVMQNIWSKAKEISLSWPAAILTWGSQSQLFLMHYYANIKVETHFIKVCAELMLSILERIDVHNPFVRKWGSGPDIVMKSKTESFMSCNLWVVTIKSYSNMVNQ